MKNIPPYQEHHVKVERTAQYIIKGRPEAPQRSITLACHGYGQLASYIADKWTVLDESKHVLISAEGLNKFYWEGVGGQPVANWMTKKNRLSDIDDFCRYLDRLWQMYGAGSPKHQKVLFGFSQGATTLWRWIHQSKPDFDIFYNYAGWIPEDIDLSRLGRYLKDRKLVLIYGKEDEYLTDDRIELQNETIKKSGLNIEVISVDGKHRIEKNVLKWLYRDV